MVEFSKNSQQKMKLGTMKLEPQKKANNKYNITYGNFSKKEDPEESKGKAMTNSKVTPKTGQTYNAAYHEENDSDPSLLPYIFKGKLGQKPSFAFESKANNGTVASLYSKVLPKFSWSLCDCIETTSTPMSRTRNTAATAKPQGQEAPTALINMGPTRRT